MLCTALDPKNRIKSERRWMCVCVCVFLCLCMDVYTLARNCFLTRKQKGGKLSSNVLTWILESWTHFIDMLNDWAKLKKLPSIWKWPIKTSRQLQAFSSNFCRSVWGGPVRSRWFEALTCIHGVLSTGDSDQLQLFNCLYTLFVWNGRNREYTLTMDFLAKTYRNAKKKLFYYVLTVQVLALKNL